MRCLTLAVASLLTLACGSGEPSVYPGFVDAPVAAVASQVPGQVASVEVREGDQVARGELLAQLDARERIAAVAQAEADLERARAALEEGERNARSIAPTVVQATAESARQRAERDDAAIDLARTQELTERGVETPARLDRARARLEQAEAAVRGSGAGRLASQGRVAVALAAVRTARAALAGSEAALQRTRVQLAQSEIRSPFDGVVAERNLETGEWAAPGTPVITVEDATRRWVRVDVDETRLGALRIGSPAEIRVIALPGRAYRGHVSEIGALGEFAVNRDVRRGRPDVRTFRVRVALDERDDELRPGMTAEVVVREREDDAR